MRITTNFGEWEEIWEEANKNAELIEEDFKSENQVHQNLDEERAEAAAFLLGRY